MSTSARAEGQQPGAAAAELRRRKCTHLEQLVAPDAADLAQYRCREGLGDVCEVSTRPRTETAVCAQEGKVRVGLLHEDVDEDAPRSQLACRKLAHSPSDVPPARKAGRQQDA